MEVNKESFCLKAGNTVYNIYKTYTGSPSKECWAVSIGDQEVKGSWERTDIGVFLYQSEAVKAAKQHGVYSYVRRNGSFIITRNPNIQNIGERIYISGWHNSVMEAFSNNRIFTEEEIVNNYAEKYLGTGNRFMKVPLPLINTIREATPNEIKYMKEMDDCVVVQDVRFMI
jgi:hypothetical protein